MIFSLTIIVSWRVVTTRNQRQIVIDNVHNNSSQVRHDYAIGDLVYVENTGVSKKLSYRKEGPYRITEVFTSSTIQFYRGDINKWVNIRRIVTHFDSTNIVPWSNWTAHIWGVDAVIDTTPLQASSIFPLFFKYLDQRKKSSFFLIFFFRTQVALYPLQG